MYRIKIFLCIFFLLLSGCGEKTREKSKTYSSAKNSLTEKGRKFTNFIFVGMADQKAGLYKYDLSRKKYKEFWSNYNEQVVELSYSPDRKSAFFLTAGHLGKKSVLPFITRVKLYLINLDSLKVKFIKNFGDGVQVFTQWENNNNFKVVMNGIDSIVATYINQQTFIYNIFGKEQLNEVQTYDLTTTGYPEPYHSKVSYNSPDGRFKLINKNADTTKIYLADIRKNRTDLIVVSDQHLNEFQWSDEGKYLIFSTIDISAKNKTFDTKESQTSGLYIYDLRKKKIVKEWNGDGIKNFFIKNDFLIFDNGFGDNSSVSIFNCRTLKIIDAIKIKGGCGLRNIPEFPNFKA